MKKIFTYLIFTLFCLNIVAIQAQESINSSGGNASSGDGSSSYSIGQVTYTSGDGNDGIINQGVQITYEIASLGVDNFPNITLQMVLYPNPTDSFVFLKIENYEFQILHSYIYDLNGKLLSNQKINSPKTIIDMNNLPASVYFLNVVDNDNILKVFKIIKNK
jgi:hypothetical protein